MSKEKKSLKAKVWRVFSKYIRTRDCIKSTGDTEYGQCVTCGQFKHIKHLQAGHYLPGRHNSTIFNEYNCHAQCVACNYYRHGNLAKYLKYMLKNYGLTEIDKLEALDKTMKKFTISELEELHKTYKQKLEGLTNENTGKGRKVQKTV